MTLPSRNPIRDVQFSRIAARVTPPEAPTDSKPPMVYTPPTMLKGLKAELSRCLAAQIRSVFNVEHTPVVSIPPRRALGDLAFPAALHLARELRKKPRDIATELLDGLHFPAPVKSVRIEGAGYLNVFLDRSAVAARLLGEPLYDPSTSAMDEAVAAQGPNGASTPAKVIVEHTNINPNKAAHIGHLRNAVLGDVLVRSLRRLGHQVETQNYIDDTGVQVADVVVGFIDVRGWSLADVETAEEPFDYLCWDVYSQVGQWFEEDKERQALRRQTLHALESGEGERAAMGRLVARRIVDRHLRTMARIGVGYDVLTRESDILGLDFFTVAFEKLKSAGAIRLEADGKNEGCWVMPLQGSEEFAGLEDPDKVIVRSDGTVTYVGKDIAYQLWKFGLLGRDFGYRPWPGGAPRQEDAPVAGTDPGEDAVLWQTTTDDPVREHPAFGAGDRVINVIDARQSYLQRIVRAGLEALGHTDAAAHSVHFAYEFVSLSTGTARQLGFLTDADDQSKSLDMSGRKGIGVKADDLLDQLEARSAEQIRERYSDLAPDVLAARARAVAIGALRFFMVKATTTRKIAFDLDEALAFEGETGPYLQYSLVRERNIRHKLDAAGMASEVDLEALAQLDSELWADDLWDLVLQAAQIQQTVERGSSSLELSLIARAALDLAAKFHHAYHRHRILDEENADLRSVRLAGFQIFRKGLIDLTELLGVPVLEQM